MFKTFLSIKIIKHFKIKKNVKTATSPVPFFRKLPRSEASPNFHHVKSILFLRWQAERQRLFQQRARRNSVNFPVAATACLLQKSLSSLMFSCDWWHSKRSYVYSDGPCRKFCHPCEGINKRVFGATSSTQWRPSISEAMLLDERYERLSHQKRNASALGYFCRDLAEVNAS